MVDCLLTTVYIYSFIFIYYLFFKQRSFVFAPLSKLLLICKKKPLCSITDVDDMIIYTNECLDFCNKCGEKGPLIETNSEYMAQEKKLMKRTKDKNKRKNIREG